MIVIMMLVFVIVATIIDSVDTRIGERSRVLVEQDQSEYYKWLDENCNPITAREWKAQTEVFIRDYWHSIGREYKPQNVAEVSTDKERKAIRKGKEYERKLSEDELAYIYENISPALEAEEVEVFAPFTFDEGKKRYADYLVSTLGISFEEAMRRVVKMNEDSGIDDGSDNIW